ncbi:MAG: UDP-glucose 4-epimerase GalE [Christensenellaceae bacterium]
MKEILVTGGAGFIGSHTVVALAEAGYMPVIVDNLVNASPNVLPRLEELTGKPIPFYRADIRDEAALERIFAEHTFEACIHFAGLKCVPESVKNPLGYYGNNLGGSLTLFSVMERHHCKNVIFSSSATVYGTAKEVPITENSGRGETTNPYGETKSVLERVLTDLTVSDPEWNVVILRYFNPVGAHESGRIGEQPGGVPNNLMPYLTQVAVGLRDHLTVYGNDYPTPDGTCIRDYIHVCDLADGHVKALSAIERNCGLQIYNLGTGIGYSVLDVISAFERATGRKIPYVFGARRAGDIPVSYADATKAKREMGWTPRYDLERMCLDAWRFQSMNPNGYDR